MRLGSCSDFYSPLVAVLTLIISRKDVGRTHTHHCTALVIYDPEAGTDRMLRDGSDSTSPFLFLPVLFWSFSFLSYFYFLGTKSFLVIWQQWSRNDALVDRPAEKLQQNRPSARRGGRMMFGYVRLGDTLLTNTTVISGSKLIWIWTVLYLKCRVIKKLDISY